MKLRYSLTGLLVLASLIFLSLLMVGGGESSAQAHTASSGYAPEEGPLRQAVSLPQPSSSPLRTPVPAAISDTSALNFTYLPFITKEVSPNSPGNVSTGDVEAQALSFDIELRALPAEVNSGDDLEYIIRYTVNNEAANNVVITSSLPVIDQDCAGNDIVAYYRYSDPSGNYSSSKRQITWNLGTVTEGTTSEVKFVVQMPTGPFDGTTFTNQAFIQGDGVSAVSEVVTTILHTHADNSLSVSPPTYVRPGDIFCVPITFDNRGTSRDTNLVLNHQHTAVASTFITATVPHTYQGNQVTWRQNCVPARTTLEYKTDLQAAASPVITTGDVITHHFAYDTHLLPPGSQNRQQRVDLGPHAGYCESCQHVFNSTRVNFDLNFSDNTSWPLDDLDFYVRLPISTTFVSLTEEGKFRCVPPAITAEVSNDPALVTPPPLSSPTWLSYTVRSHPFGEPDPHPAPGTTWVHVQAGPIDWSRNFILTVDYTGLSGGTVITTTGTYSSNQINGDVAIPFVIPAFEFDKHGPGTISAAEDMEYRLRIKNVSGATAYGVVVTDTLPPETTFIAATNDGSYDPAAHQVTWPLGQMESGQEKNLHLTVNVKRGLLDKTNIHNQAEMTFAGYSGTPIKRTHTTLVRSHPFFQVTHQPEKQYVPSGGLITYTITYYNHGTGASNDALVISLLPDKTVFVRATTPNGEQLSYDETEIHWARPISVPVDVAQIIQLVVRNEPPSPDGTVITNVVSISSSQSLLAIGNLTNVTIGTEPVSVPKDDNDDDDDDDDEHRDMPTPTPTPLPLPSPTPSPTPVWPSLLPETGCSPISDSGFVFAGLLIGCLILIGVSVHYRLFRSWLHHK